MTGRPTIFTQEIADEICARLAEGEPLRAICADDHLPERQTIHNWNGSNESFFVQYTRARMDQANNESDELMEIARDSSVDIADRRLVVDTIKWRLSKMLPKVYGDKVDHNHQGAINLNIDSELASTL